MADSRPRSGDTLLMVGTRKGAHLLWRSEVSEEWRRAFHQDGWEVDSLAYDPRDGGLLAATTSPVFGSVVQRSADFGASWTSENHGLDFAPDSEHRVRRVWAVQPGPAERPGRVFAGVEHAGLFVSDDLGVHWEGVEGLNTHPTSAGWQPGGGGLMTHCIESAPDDPSQLFVGVSAGGFYRSDDDGASWRPLNRGIRADFMPDPEAESGHCVHRFVVHAERPDTVYQQNHCGVYRSDDRGEHWREITKGLPSEFGFPMTVDAHDPDCIYVVPQVGPERRVFPDHQMRVWRSVDGGESWEARGDGLPDEAYFTVMRAAMATDDARPSGVYVGTTGGQLYYSADGGDRWELLLDSLARVLCVATATVV